MLSLLYAFLPTRLFMPRVRLRFYLSFIIFQFFLLTHLQAETVCGRFVTPDQIKWTTSEKRTLCGSSDTPSWQNIPFNQAEFFFRSFLQSRGYHNPSFEKRDDEKLYVRPGKLTFVSKIRTFPERADLLLDKYWYPIGRPLTPEQLNDIEKWFAFKLGRLGYACPKFTMSANKETGEVLINFNTGEHWTIDEITGSSIPQVEDVLAGYPGVRQVAVIGVPDPKWGEAVKAVVVLQAGASVSAKELMDRVRAQKGPVQTPKSIDFVDAIPLTAVGKPDKKVLRAQYRG